MTQKSPNKEVLSKQGQVSSEMVQRIQKTIENSLELKKDGKPHEYEKMVLNLNNLKMIQVGQVYEALYNLHSKVKDFLEIQEVIFKPQNDVWFTKGSGSAIDNYTKLVLSLLVGDNGSVFLKPFLTILIRNLSENYNNADMANVKFENIHNLIKQISQKIPQSSLLILPILKNYYPHANRNVLDNKYYVQNLLNIKKYIPSIRKELSELICGHSLSINDNQKMDDVLTLFFDYLDSTTDLDETFQHLLFIFKKYVLPARNPVNVQYIWFYVCAKDQQYVESFIKMLLEIIFTSNCSNEIKRNACAYLGGFIARTNYIKRKKIQDVVDFIFHWISKYISKNQQKGSFINSSAHALFYSVFNSLAYMLCFKLTIKYKLKEKIDEVITSFLAPLQVIEKELAEVFSQKYKEVYSKPLPKNQYNMTISKKDYVEDFYPFNPLEIPKSQKYIHDLYHFWQVSENDSMNLSNSYGFSSGDFSQRSDQLSKKSIEDIDDTDEEDEDEFENNISEDDDHYLPNEFRLNCSLENDE